MRPALFLLFLSIIFLSGALEGSIPPAPSVIVSNQIISRNIPPASEFIVYGIIKYDNGTGLADVLVRLNITEVNSAWEGKTNANGNYLAKLRAPGTSGAYRLHAWVNHSAASPREEELVLSVIPRNAELSNATQVETASPPSQGHPEGVTLEGIDSLYVYLAQVENMTASHESELRTARDLLDHSRYLFGRNERGCKALNGLAEEKLNEVYNAALIEKRGDEGEANAVVEPSEEKNDAAEGNATSGQTAPPASPTDMLGKAFVMLLVLMLVLFLCANAGAMMSGRR